MYKNHTSTQLKLITICFLLLIIWEVLPAQSYQQVDSLRTVADQRDGLPKIYALADLFRAVMRSDIERAISIAEEADQLAAEIDSDKGRALVGTMYCQIYQSTSKFDSLYRLANQGAELSKRIHSDTILARFQLYKGIYHEKAGTLDSAIYWYKEVIALKAINPIFTNNNLGLVYLKLGQTEQGAHYLKLAIEAAQESKDLAVEAIISNNLGRIYANIGDEERAKKYYLRSIELKKQIGDKRGTLFALANLTTLGSLPKEEINGYTEQGFALAQQLNDPYFIAAFAPRKANVLSSSGKHEEALALLLPIYENYSGSKTGDEYLEILSSLSKIYNRKGSYSKAKPYALEWIKITESNGQLKTLQSARSQLLEIYRNQSDYKAYFDLAPVFFAGEDSLRKATNIKQLAELENKLRDVEQEKEIALLNTELRQKEARRKWLLAIAVFIAIILSIIIYFRSRQVKTQKLLIEQEKANALQLKSVNQQLKNLDQMKSRFFTNISHELRTPVTLISTPLSNSLARYSSKMRDEVRASVQIANRNANKLNVLVEELLELSRLEAGKVSLHKRAINAHTYINQLYAAFESGAVTKNIDYQIHNLLPKELYLLIDKKHFSKIVNNLISNALKFTAQNGTVSLNASITEHNILEIEVSDTGRGIPEEDIPHIFDRYYQTQNKAISTEGGTGIGLALAKELAETMGGNLAVKSEWKKGSQFILTLPVEVTEETSQHIEEEARPAVSVVNTVAIDTPKTTTDERYKILIVEDNPDMQLLLTQVLADQYDYLIANNGAEAWSLLEHNKQEVENIQLILSDVMMPQMDGYELLNHIKSHDRWRKYPVIMLTAKVAEEDKLRALRMGVDDYLAKPFSAKELLARVGNLISKHEERKAFEKLGIQLEFESTSSADQEWLKQLEDSCLEAIDKGINITNSYLSETLATSERQLQRRVKALTGLSVKKYVQEIRLQKARYLLENKAYNTIAEIAHASGFNTPKYFSQIYEKHFGKRPAFYLE